MRSFFDRQLKGKIAKKTSMNLSFIILFLTHIGVEKREINLKKRFLMY